MDSDAPFDLSVAIPAHDEARWIGPCLDAVAASKGPLRAQVIVVANGCSDDTAARARGVSQVFAARGWRLDVVELARGSKPGALNAADKIAEAPVRAYLDADVQVDEDVLGQITDRLTCGPAAYASGRLRIAPPVSGASRAYARIYRKVPFVARGVPGCGLFAVNAAGRARWDDWPAIISDDTFARLHFSGAERHRVCGSYTWPLVEGWRALVKVRRRQNRGVDEVLRRFPALAANDDTPGVPLRDKLGMAVKDPVGFAVYGGVALATKIGGDTGWSRGR